MSELLFGQSYYLRFDPKLWEAMQPYPPLGTLYAASYLRERDYDVALFDAMLAESEMQWGAALDQEQPRYAILYEDNFNYLSKMCLLRMREAAFTMTEMAKQRGCIVIACGADATDHAEEYLRRGVDYVILGEGEITLGELLDTLENGEDPLPLAEIPALAFLQNKETDDQLVKTAERPIIRDLDSLPFPAWDLVDIPKYRQIWLEHHGYYSVNMVTTRGCLYHCNWCAKPIWGQRYHSRSPQNVVAELKWLQETYGVEHIWFVDDIMGLKPRWLHQFADEIEANNVHVRFKCLSRVDLLLRKGDVDALRRAGAEIIWVGAESGSQKILDAMEKGTKVEQIYEATEQLHAADIKVAYFLQFGYPGETRQDIEKTLQMIRDCQPDDIGMSVSYPLLGTKFHQQVQDELGTKRNWQDSSDLAMLYQGPYATQFYRQLHTVLHKEFRARKTWHTLKHMASHPNQLQGSHLRQAAAMIYHRATLWSARQKLNRLEAIPHKGLGPLKPTMNQEAAATPSPQIEATTSEVINSSHK
ncbi:B12-binding domain-containing radical SAM protein [Chloroflexi bacterium TSY]|nr:B12-binding domain-containing radical SAM protein [Chloroflexi bacterium TSY]